MTAKPSGGAIHGYAIVWESHPLPLVYKRQYTARNFFCQAPALHPLSAILSLKKMGRNRLMGASVIASEAEPRKARPRRRRGCAQDTRAKNFYAFIRSGVCYADPTIDKFPYRTSLVEAPEQWGLIPRRSAAVRVGNTNKNLVVDGFAQQTCTIDKFPCRTCSRKRCNTYEIPRSSAARRFIMKMKFPTQGGELHSSAGAY
jgi:hypothetical protein